MRRTRTALKSSNNYALVPNELNARLTAAAAERPSPLPRQRSRTLSPDPTINAHYQSASYHELVEDGGQAPFPLSRLQEVLDEPRSYLEPVRPWMRDLRGISWDDGEAISRELSRWREFRKWQRNDRGMPGIGFSEYLEREKRDFIALKAPELIDDPDFKLITRRQWEREEGSCQQHQRGSLSAYAVTAKRRLSDHGFTQPFHLEENPKRQDPWTTWAEYLVYEYWQLDVFTSRVKGLQPEFDKGLETHGCHNIQGNGWRRGSSPDQSRPAMGD